MLQLVVVEPQQFDKLFLLAHEIWHQHYVPIIGLEQVEYMLQKMYSPAALQQQIFAGQTFYFINSEMQTVGFVGLSTGTQAFIHKFYIHPHFQNQGLGLRVFEEIVKELKNPSSIELTVNRQNYKSINFYFKCGFVIKEVADFDIGNNYFMNDFVMRYTKK